VRRMALRLVKDGIVVGATLVAGGGVPCARG
jgi:hypothetical protein